VGLELRGERQSSVPQPGLVLNVAWLVRFAGKWRHLVKPRLTQILFNVSLTATLASGSKEPFTSPQYAARYTGIGVVARGPNAALFRLVDRDSDSGWNAISEVTMNLSYPWNQSTPHLLPPWNCRHLCSTHTHAMIVGVVRGAGETVTAPRVARTIIQAWVHLQFRYCLQCTRRQ
jgi:hypothetical protein